MLHIKTKFRHLTNVTHLHKNKEATINATHWYIM